jgi:hypothetical protein
VTITRDGQVRLSATYLFFDQSLLIICELEVFSFAINPKAYTGKVFYTSQARKSVPTYRLFSHQNRIFQSILSPNIGKKFLIALSFRLWFGS